ncbi:MAG: hypothetical protein U1E36_06435 [Rickettsiales bacterium]
MPIERDGAVGLLYDYSVEEIASTAQNKRDYMSVDLQVGSTEWNEGAFIGQNRHPDGRVNQLSALVHAGDHDITKFVNGQQIPGMQAFAISNLISR